MIDKMLQEYKGDYINKAFRLEKAMQDMPEELQLELEPLHYFADGMYLRSLFIPEGVVCTGEIHKYSHFTILAEGKSKIVSQDGEMEVEAPFVFISTPYAKRSVYAITDCTWMTVHLNHDNCQDIPEIENRHVYKDKKQLEEVKKLLGVEECLSQLQQR